MCIDFVLILNFEDQIIFGVTGLCHFLSSCCVLDELSSNGWVICSKMTSGRCTTLGVVASTCGTDFLAKYIGGLFFEISAPELSYSE